MSTVIAGTESGTSLAPLFHETLQRLGRQSANCKLGTVLGLTILLMVALLVGNASLLWAAAPLALLALADAGYAAQARRIAEFGRRLNGQKDSVRPGDLMQLQASGWEFQGALSGLAGFLSFTVWPFYLCLAGLAIGLGSTVVVPMVKVAPESGPRLPANYMPPVTSRPGGAGMPGRPPINASKTPIPHLPVNPITSRDSMGGPPNGPQVPGQPLVKPNLIGPTSARPRPNPTGPVPIPQAPTNSGSAPAIAPALPASPEPTSPKPIPQQISPPALRGK